MPSIYLKQLVDAQRQFYDTTMKKEPLLFGQKRKNTKKNIFFDRFVFLMVTIYFCFLLWNSMNRNWKERNFWMSLWQKGRHLLTKSVYLLLRRNKLYEIAGSGAWSFILTYLLGWQSRFDAIKNNTSVGTEIASSVKLS